MTDEVVHVPAGTIIRYGSPDWHSPYPSQPRDTSGDGSGSLRPIVFCEDAATIQAACVLIAKLVAGGALARSLSDEALAFLRRHGDRTITQIMDDARL